MGNPEAAAEGATLGLWLYQGFKDKQKQKVAPQIQLCSENEAERYIPFFHLMKLINKKNDIIINLW